jgi:hypothetical protein
VTKIAGSGFGFISQRHRSVDPEPDPNQNVMDPQHWKIERKNFIYLLHAISRYYGYNSIMIHHRWAPIKQ